MDLTNKELTMRYMSTDNAAQTTSVTVEVSAEVADGVFQIEGTYQLNFATAYNNMADERLMPDIIAKLEALP